MILWLLWQSMTLGGEGSDSCPIYPIIPGCIHDELLNVNNRWYTLHRIHRPCGLLHFQSVALSIILPRTATSTIAPTTEIGAVHGRGKRGTRFHEARTYSMDRQK